MKIGYNAPSMQAYNALIKSDRNMLASSAKLSSGVKINSASQNAAGLAISNTLRTQAEGLDKANQNASNAISMLQTLDGSLNEVHSILQRMRELGIQAANDTNSPEDRANLQCEIDELSAEIDKMADRCEYNQIKLLRGGMKDADGNDLSLTFHVGANKGYNMKVSVPELSARMLGMYTKVSDPGAFADYQNYLSPGGTSTFDVSPLSLVDNPSSMITRADDAIDQIAKLRAHIGAYSNRLEHTSAYLDASHVAATTSLSRIYDTDMAAEMSNYSRLQVLTQSATSIMAQANQTPQRVLQLLQ